MKPAGLTAKKKEYYVRNAVAGVKNITYANVVTTVILRKNTINMLIIASQHIGKEY